MEKNKITDHIIIFITDHMEKNMITDKWWKRTNPTVVIHCRVKLDCVVVTDAADGFASLEWPGWPGTLGTFIGSNCD
jgi:hypothetical protein